MKTIEYRLCAAIAVAMVVTSAPVLAQQMQPEAPSPSVQSEEQTKRPGLLGRIFGSGQGADESLPDPVSSEASIREAMSAGTATETQAKPRPARAGAPVRRTAVTKSIRPMPRPWLDFHNREAIGQETMDDDVVSVAEKVSEADAGSEFAEVKAIVLRPKARPADLKIPANHVPAQEVSPADPVQNYGLLGFTHLTMDSFRIEPGSVASIRMDPVSGEPRLTNPLPYRLAQLVPAEPEIKVPNALIDFVPLETPEGKYLHREALRLASVYGEDRLLPDEIDRFLLVSRGDAIVEFSNRGSSADNLQIVSASYDLKQPDDGDPVARFRSFMATSEGIEAFSRMSPEQIQAMASMIQMMERGTAPVVPEGPSVQAGLDAIPPLSMDPGSAEPARVRNVGDGQSLLAQGWQIGQGADGSWTIFSSTDPGSRIALREGMVLGGLGLVSAVSREGDHVVVRFQGGEMIKKIPVDERGEFILAGN